MCSYSSTAAECFLTDSMTFTNFCLQYLDFCLVEHIELKYFPLISIKSMNNIEEKSSTLKEIMAEIDYNLDLYKTPSAKILRERKEFYGLWRRCDYQIPEWLNRVQSHFNRCEFPALISLEYLLIDKFVCELDHNEKECIQSEDTWTLTKLNEFFVHRKMTTETDIADKNINVNQTFDQNPEISSSVALLKCEFVSETQNCKFILVCYSIPNYLWCFQNNYEYSENIANIEVVKQENLFIEMKYEPNTITEQNVFARMNAQNDERLGAKEPKTDFDTINELIPIDSIKYEFVSRIELIIPSICKCLLNHSIFLLCFLQNYDCQLGNNVVPTFDPPNKEKQKHHSKTKNTCDICNRLFTQSHSLKTHKMAVHQKIRPYECTQCAKCFSKSSDLKRHWRIHSVQRRFACDRCFETFKKSHELERHLRKHMEGKTYSCDQCNESFVRSSRLIQHKKMLHQGISAIK